MGRGFLAKRFLWVGVMASTDKASTVLLPAFFQRPADDVARRLLGRTVVRRLGVGTIALTITETEAYLGPHDLACHAAGGRTARTEVMYGRPGTLYIYLVYALDAQRCLRREGLSLRGVDPSCWGHHCSSSDHPSAQNRRGSEQ